MLLMRLKGLQGEARGPVALVQIHEHLFFEFIFSIINDNGIVVAVQSVNEGLNTRFLQVSDVGGGLAGLLSHHHELRINESEAVDDDLALDGLDGVHDECDSAIAQGFEAGLGVDVGGGEPATKSGMRVVPAHDDLGTSRLSEHVHHVLLKGRIDAFDTDGSTRLRHSEDVHAVNGVFVDELSEHESHDFHGDPGPSVLEHFEQGEARYVHLFGTVGRGSVAAASPGAGHSAHHLLEPLHVVVEKNVCVYVFAGTVERVWW